MGMAVAKPQKKGKLIKPKGCYCHMQGAEEKTCGVCWCEQEAKAKQKHALLFSPTQEAILNGQQLSYEEMRWQGMQTQAAQEAKAAKDLQQAEQEQKVVLEEKARLRTPISASDTDSTSLPGSPTGTPKGGHIFSSNTINRIIALPKKKGGFCHNSIEEIAKTSCGECTRVYLGWYNSYPKNELYKDFEGRNLMWWAAYYGNTEYVKQLLSQSPFKKLIKSSMLMWDNEGYTPFHAAALGAQSKPRALRAASFEKLQTILVEARANPDCISNAGQTARELFRHEYGMPSRGS